LGFEPKSVPPRQLARLAMIPWIFRLESCSAGGLEYLVNRNIRDQLKDSIYSRVRDIVSELSEVLSAKWSIHPQIPGKDTISMFDYAAGSNAHQV